MPEILPPTRSNSTRERIVRAAEKLFARKGFQGMTLRAVTREAKVNLAAVNYHFGSKRDLMYAIARSRFEPINSRRIEILDALTARHSPDPIPLRDVIDALFRPLFEAATTPDDPGQVLVQMIGRAMSEPAEFMRELHRDFFSDLIRRVLTELKRTLPDLPLKELYYRLYFAIGTMVSSTIDQVRLETISEGTIKPTDVNGMVDRLVDFTCAGFMADSSASDE